MTRPPHRLWQDMTTEDFSVLERERAVAVLPVAAVEQHGPHLPLWVDSCINQGIIDRVLATLPEDVPAIFLPMLPVGLSTEHAAFPGTLTLSAETLIRLWTEIGESVAAAGIRKLVLFNSHGGQPQIMDIVARDLRARLAMFVVTVNYWALGLPSGLFPETERTHGIHGGSVETSLMLHLRPDLVREEKRQNFISATVEMEQRYDYLRAQGSGIGFGWQTQDLNAQGACGNALDADAERGRKIVETVAERFIALLREIDRFPLSALRGRD